MPITVTLQKEDLKTLVRGSQLNGDDWKYLVILKAGYSYSDQYGKTSWSSLDSLTEEELYKVYEICRDSWVKKDN